MCSCTKVCQNVIAFHDGHPDLKILWPEGDPQSWSTLSSIVQTRAKTTRDADYSFGTSDGSVLLQPGQVLGICVNNMWISSERGQREEGVGSRRLIVPQAAARWWACAARELYLTGIPTSVPATPGCTLPSVAPASFQMVGLLARWRLEWRGFTVTWWFRGYLLPVWPWACGLTSLSLYFFPGKWEQEFLPHRMVETMQGGNARHLAWCQAQSNPHLLPLCLCLFLSLRCRYKYFFSWSKLLILLIDFLGVDFLHRLWKGCRLTLYERLFVWFGLLSLAPSWEVLWVLPPSTLYPAPSVHSQVVFWGSCSTVIMKTLQSVTELGWVACQEAGSYISHLSTPAPSESLTHLQGACFYHPSHRQLLLSQRSQAPFCYPLQVQVFLSTNCFAVIHKDMFSCFWVWLYPIRFVFSFLYLGFHCFVLRVQELCRNTKLKGANLAIDLFPILFSLKIKI